VGINGLNCKQHGDRSFQKDSHANAAMERPSTALAEEVKRNLLTLAAFPVVSALITDL
jgi:hypothetical protein